MASEPTGRVRTSAVVGFAIAAGLAGGIGVGWHYGARYYNGITGDWHVALHTGLVGLKYGAPVAVGTALAAAAIVLIVAEIAPGMSRLLSSPARLRRLVLAITTRLLVLSGVFAGIGGGWAYYSTADNLVLAVVVGLLAALGAWVAAALISLFVEIANSLRTIAERSEETAPHPKETFSQPGIGSPLPEPVTD